MTGTASPHFRGVRVKYACVMSFPVLGKEFHNFRVNLISIVLAGLHSHADASIWLKRTLKGFVSLKAYNGLPVLV